MGVKTVAMTETLALPTDPAPAPTDPPAVDVVIVNWNSGRHLAACLDALAPGDGSIRVIVIDNASTDGSAEAAAGRAGVALRVNDANRGFGAACNQGAALGASPLILFLNPDTIASPAAVAALAGALARTPAAGIAGPALTDPDGRIVPTCSALPRWRDLVGRALGLDRLGLVATAFLPARGGPVGQVMGACLMIRRDLFERLGGFDERFFLYFEEVDLSRRALDRGALSLYAPEVRVVHVGRGSSDGIKSRRLHLWLVSRLRYARKHWGLGAALALHGVAITIEPLARCVALLLQGRTGEIPGALGAHLRYAGDPGPWGPGG